MRQCPPCSPWSECAFVRARIDKTAKAVLFPMLSGRLWSRDQQAEPAAAMNHCIVEPPLDRRGEGGGGSRTSSRMDGGGGGGEQWGDERQREGNGERMQEENKAGGSRGERRWTRMLMGECAAICWLCSANVTANLENVAIKLFAP